MPDPVPVVTSVGRAGPCSVESRAHALAWCRHGANPGKPADHSSSRCQPSSATWNGVLIRR
ncbi:hypothetical protein KVH15_23815 [Streptomyces olivaceus]|nr:hypothetical protein [Streptomyces olivaceus]